MDIRTDRLKLKDVFPDKAKAYAKKLKTKAGEIEFVRKGIPINPDNIEIKEGERAAIRLITTPHLDRDQEILIPSGAVLDDFRQSPSVLFGHDYRSLPIGSDQWIKHVKEGILAKTIYAKHQFAEDVFQCVKDGHLNSNSVGFIPVEAVSKDGGDAKKYEAALDMLEKEYGIKRKVAETARNIYTKWILLEHSDVPVPSNAQSLNVAVAKGELVIHSEKLRKELEIDVEMDAEKEDKEIEIEYTTDDGERHVDVVTGDEAGSILYGKDNEVVNILPAFPHKSDGSKLTEEDLDRLIEIVKDEAVMKPETTDDYHRIPVEDADDHKGHKIRTIDVSKEKGIKALYCVECKKIITYLFTTDKWTMEEAQAWVDEHKDFEPPEEKQDDEESDDSDEGEKFNCECIECGHKLTSETHCNELECPKCGGEMRRAERPGPGREAPAIAEIRITDLPEFREYHESIKAQLAELKEGRVLSTKNRTLVKEIIESLAVLRERLEELYNATEPSGREDDKPTEREFVLERKGADEDMAASVSASIERLFKSDKIGPLVEGVIKEAIDVHLKKRLGRVE
jgi:hypothetical protein